MAKDVEPAPPRPADFETDYRPINWKRFFLTPKYIPWHILGIAALIATVLVAVYQDAVVRTLRPFSESLRDLPAGWLIPIAILFVISFPPLFGHELIAMLCGIVWGLWIGFGIVAAGTFIGEVGTWYAFKYLFRKKSEKMERTNLNYCALARLTREGGFWIVLAIRLSVIPSHFSTAVFSACDTKFWHFAVATFLSLPKQIVLVYLGVLIIGAEDGAGGKSSSDTIIKAIVFGATFAVTIILGVWIWRKMRVIKKDLLAEQDARRSAKAAGANITTATAASEPGLEMQNLVGGPGREFDNGAGDYYEHPYRINSPPRYDAYEDPRAARAPPPAYGYARHRRWNSDEDDLGSVQEQQPARWV